MNKTLKNILLMPMNLFYKISPENELKLMFYLRQGYRLNLSNPVTFNEKLNWMKLYYRNDLIPICADKYAVRQYIKDCGYEELLNDLLWEGFDANEIPFDKLPSQFVIKVTHGSGLNIICKDKAELNVKHTIKTINKWLKQKYIPCYGEWFYGRLKPRIIIEKFLSEDGDTVPVDYKLYYFNNIIGTSNIGFTAVITERFTKRKETFFDENWEVLPQLTFGSPNDTNFTRVKPMQYDTMVEIAATLAKPFLHTRIDFYLIRGRLYFGEITFISEAGFSHIKPREFEVKMGDWIKLPDSLSVE